MTAFPDPWKAVEKDSVREALEKGLRNEMPPGHILEGRSFRAIARDYDDNVLYELDGGPSLALVHRTYQKPTDPDFPHTIFFDSLEEFLSDPEDDDYED